MINDPINNELSKLYGDELDKALDAIADGLKKAGHPHMSIKAMMAMRKPNPPMGWQCPVCEKIFLETEAKYDDGYKCPTCGGIEV